MDKKRRKYIWLSIVGILAFVIFLNLGKIKFMFSMIGSYNRINKDNYEDVADNNESIEPVENPLPKIISEEENPSEIEKDDIDENNIENGDKENVTTDKNNSKSYINIVSDFNNEFELLKKDYEAKLDSLVRLGYKEYKSGEVSTAKLVSKYMNEGSRLEKECDTSFNSMLKQMEKDLKDNGHDTAVVKDLKEYYNSYKEVRRGQLMSKAKGRVK